MDKIQLQKVQVIGRKYFHVFDIDGNLIEVETTQEDYEQLGAQKPINPTIEKGTWKHSYARYKLDTMDGDLGENQYCDNGNNYLLKNEGKMFYAKLNEVVNDAIETQVLADALVDLAQVPVPIIKKP